MHKDPDFDEVIDTGISGKGDGQVRVDLQHSDGSIHRFLVPYSLEHSPSTLQLVYYWENTVYRADPDEQIDFDKPVESDFNDEEKIFLCHQDNVPDQVSEIVSEMSTDVCKKADF